MLTNDDFLIFQGLGRKTRGGVRGSYRQAHMYDAAIMAGLSDDGPHPTDRHAERAFLGVDLLDQIVVGG